MKPSPLPILENLRAVYETVHRLRAPGGCPWDREQTHQSLRPFLIEEAYEVLDTIDALPEAPQASPHPPSSDPASAAFAAFKEELGDLLLQILLHSEIASESGSFDFGDVAQTLNEKLIRRHPHVFGTQENVKTSDAVLQNWEKLKAQEKPQSKTSVLDGTPKGLPALQRTARVIDKVSKVGFQWPDLEGPLAKLDEEIRELKVEIQAPNPDPKKIESELGDLLFCVCNVARFLKANPEDALRGTLSKFERRFRHVESRLKEQGRTPQEATLEEMDRYWDEAKAQE